jgi:hypothetical protein
MAGERTGSRLAPQGRAGGDEILRRTSRPAPYDPFVETIYRTKARTVPRSVMRSGDRRAQLHALLLEEARVGIAEGYGEGATPKGRGVVQVVDELPDGRVSVLLTVAIRERARPSDERG